MKNLKPIVKLTSKQVKNLLARIVEEESAAPISKAMKEVAPATEPVERVFGRLSKNVGTREMPEWKTVDYPWAEAQTRYLRNPELYEPSKIEYPPVTRMRFEPTGTDEASQLAQKIAYERIRYKPVKSINELQARKELQPSFKPEVKSENVDTFEDTLEKIWKGLGGKRTKIGRYWETLRSQSHLHHIVKDSKAFFISCAKSWHKNPKGYERQHPREARLLKSIWEELPEK
jgi:hypothetical protein